jgi:hypothetical protein
VARPKLVAPDLEEADLTPLTIPLLNFGLNHQQPIHRAPDGSWWRQRGMVIEPDGSFVKGPGYQTYVPATLSPESQGFFWGQGTINIAGATVTILWHNSGAFQDVADREIATNWQIRFYQPTDTATWLDTGWLDIASWSWSRSAASQTVTLAQAFTGTLSGIYPQFLLRKVSNPIGFPTQLLRRFLLADGLNEVLIAGTARDLATVAFDGSGNATGFTTLTRQLTGVTTIQGANAATYNTTIPLALVTNGVVAGCYFYRALDGRAKATRVATSDNSGNFTLTENYRGAVVGVGGNITDGIFLRPYANEADSVAVTRRWWACAIQAGQPNAHFYAANGKDFVQRSTGNAVFQDIKPTFESGTVLSSAYVVMPFFDSLCFGYTIEAATRFPRRVRWTIPFVYSGGNESFEDFKYTDLQSDDQIVGAAPLGRNLVWFGSRSIHRQRWVGAPYDFAFDPVVPGFGCAAPGSIQTLREAAVVFLGSDFDLYTFDGEREVRVGGPVRDFFRKTQLDRSVLYRIESQVQNDTGLYLLALPISTLKQLNWVTLAWDSARNVWLEPWEGFLGYGQFTQSWTPTIDSITDLIDTHSELIDSVTLAQAPLSVAGGLGTILQLYYGGTAGGSDLVAQPTSPFTDFATRGLKRVAWIEIDAEPSGETIFVEIGQSSSGARNEVAWSDARPVVLDASQSERGILVPVNLTARYFAIRVTHRVAGRVAIGSVTWWWRPLGVR